jgi:hypothetical protein
MAAGARPIRRCNRNTNRYSKRTHISIEERVPKFVGADRVMQMARFAMLGVLTVGCGTLGGGSARDESKTLSHESAAVGCCVEDVDAPPNVAFDQRVNELGFSGADVAAAVRGRHRIEVRREPWFEAPAAQPELRTLTLDITPHERARYRCTGDLQVDADVRLIDEATGISIERSTKLSGYGARDADPRLRDIALDAEFDSPELAAALHLPPAAESGRAADRFSISAGSGAGKWVAALDSVRGGNHCRVFGPSKREQSACDDYADLVGGFEPPIRQVLSAPFAGGRIGDVAESVRDIPLQRVRWKDGSSTTLRIEATKLEFACTNSPAGAADAASVVVIPLELHVTTQDGKLDATVPAMLRAFAEDGPWNGSAELASALVPVTTLTATDWDAIFSLGRNQIGLFSISISLPNPREGASRLWLTAYTPYAGVPNYPNVTEYASNRIGCFSNGEPAPNDEVAITPVTD